MKRVMIVGGGEWQVPIIKKAKAEGLFVVNSNLLHASPGFSYSDVGLVADILDVEKNIQIAQQYKVDAVITDQSDIAVKTVAEIAERIGLPGIGSKLASLFTNKYLMRELLFKHGFPTPSYKICKTLSDVYDFTQVYGFPVVIKPPANQSSRGVIKVVSNMEMEGAYEAALQHSHSGEVLIEEFIGGTEITVDGIKLNSGRHYCLAASIKEHYKHNEMVAKRLFFSHDHLELDYERLYQQHNRLIDSMGLPFGITHAEYKYYKGEFFLIEVAARGGGTKLSSDIVPLMSGVDSNKLLIKMALGEQVDAIFPRLEPLVSALEFMEFEPGRIKSISGLQKARSISGVVDVGLSVKVGDNVRAAEDDRSRHGYFIAFARSASALRDLLDLVHKTVKVSYE